MSRAHGEPLHVSGPAETAQDGPADRAAHGETLHGAGRLDGPQHGPTHGEPLHGSGPSSTETAGTVDSEPLHVDGPSSASTPGTATLHGAGTRAARAELAARAAQIRGALDHIDTTRAQLRAAGTSLPAPAADLLAHITRANGRPLGLEPLTLTRAQLDGTGPGHALAALIGAHRSATEAAARAADDRRLIHGTQPAQPAQTAQPGPLDVPRVPAPGAERQAERDRITARLLDTYGPTTVAGRPVRALELADGTRYQLEPSTDGDRPRWAPTSATRSAPDRHTQPGTPTRGHAAGTARHSRHASPTGLHPLDVDGTRALIDAGTLSAQLETAQHIGPAGITGPAGRWHIGAPDLEPLEHTHQTAQEPRTVDHDDDSATCRACQPPQDLEPTPARRRLTETTDGPAAHAHDCPRRPWLAAWPTPGLPAPDWPALARRGPVCTCSAPQYGPQELEPLEPWTLTPYLYRPPMIGADAWAQAAQLDRLTRAQPARAHLEPCSGCPSCHQRGTSTSGTPGAPAGWPADASELHPAGEALHALQTAIQAADAHRAARAALRAAQDQARAELPTLQAQAAQDVDRASLPDVDDVHPWCPITGRGCACHGIGPCPTVTPAPIRGLLASTPQPQPGPCPACRAGCHLIGGPCCPSEGCDPQRVDDHDVPPCPVHDAPQDVDEDPAACPAGTCRLPAAPCGPVCRAMPQDRHQ